MRPSDARKAGLSQAAERVRCAVQNNVYRLGLLTHLQNEHVPLKVPECLRDLRTMYEAATIDDVNDAYAQFQMDDDHVFTCVGTSGVVAAALHLVPKTCLSAWVACAPSMVRSHFGV